MNERFMSDGHVENENYDYAELTLILTKVIKVPVKHSKVGAVKTECAYVDGVTGDLYNNINLKVETLTAGNYIVFYRGEFKGHQQWCHRLNNILMCPHHIDLKRISAKMFG